MPEELKEISSDKIFSKNYFLSDNINHDDPIDKDFENFEIISIHYTATYLTLQQGLSDKGLFFRFVLYEKYYNSLDETSGIKSLAIEKVSTDAQLERLLHEQLVTIRKRPPHEVTSILNDFYGAIETTQLKIEFKSVDTEQGRISEILLN